MQDTSCNINTKKPKASSRKLVTRNKLSEA